MSFSGVPWNAPRERLEDLGQDIPSYVKVETLFITVVQKGDVWDVNAPHVHE